jgi:hypothetical protein
LRRANTATNRASSQGPNQRIATGQYSAANPGNHRQQGCKVKGFRQSRMGIGGELPARQLLNASKLLIANVNKSVIPVPPVSRQTTCYILHDITPRLT